jgi:hypothetical protein
VSPPSRYPVKLPDTRLPSWRSSSRPHVESHVPWKLIPAGNIRGFGRSKPEQPLTASAITMAKRPLTDGIIA